MGRPSKKTETATPKAQKIVDESVTTIEEPVIETETSDEIEVVEMENEEPVIETEQKIPAHVEKLMRLYPQYQKFWVTPKGFVHPANASQYLIKGAILYTNKFYNKND